MSKASCDRAGECQPAPAPEAAQSASRTHLGPSSSVVEAQDTLARLAGEWEQLQRELESDDGAHGLAAVLEHSHVNPHINIGWPEMPAGLVPKLRAYAQKITRRLLRWYINPIVVQQNVFNADVASAMVNQSRSLDALALQLDQIRQRIEALALRASHAGRLESQSIWTPFEEANRPHRRAALAIGEWALFEDTLVSARRRQEIEGEGGIVVHLGCGLGETVEFASLLGMNAYGVEVDVDAAEMARSMHRNVVAGDPAEFIHTFEDGELTGVIVSQGCWTAFLGRADLEPLPTIMHKLGPGAFMVVGPACGSEKGNWQSAVESASQCGQVLRELGIGGLQLRLALDSVPEWPMVVVVGHVPDNAPS